MLKHVAQAAIAGNDVAESNWTKMQGKSFVVPVIVQATVDLNLAIIEENDMANRPLAPKNVLTGKASPFHLQPSQMGICPILPQIEHCHTPPGQCQLSAHSWSFRLAARGVYALVSTADSSGFTFSVWKTTQ